MSQQIVKNSTHFLPPFLLLLLALGNWHCTRDPAPTTSATEERNADTIIDRAVGVHGMDVFDELTLSFTFRERQYSVVRDGGKFAYTRSFVDSTGRQIEDVLTNDGLQRSVSGMPVGLAEEDAEAYTSSVNSVRYFFMLPYGLRDPSVRTRLLDPAVINEREYDRIEVTFDGTDPEHDDVYHYFFNRDNGEMDYLAYSFDANDGGIRFREAINKRRVGGVLIQDYKNYGMDGDDRDLSRIDQRFFDGELPLLSTIVNTEVTIKGQVGGQ